MRKAIITVLLICMATLSLQAAESNMETTGQEISFSRSFHSSTTSVINNNLHDNAPELGVLAGGRGSGSRLFRTGSTLLATGIVFGLVGGICIGAAYGILLYGGLSIANLTATTLDIMGLIASIGELAYIAVSLIVIGAILLSLSVLWIPGMILMIVGASRGRGSRIHHLNDQIGFGIRL
jgi:hypothetical protein